MPTWKFQMLQNVAEKHGWHKFISMQNYHNLLYREDEREMIPYCRSTGVGLIPVSSITILFFCSDRNIVVAHCPRVACTTLERTKEWHSTRRK